MTNNPKSDFIYAILAMDSYNRGYDSGIRDLGETGALGGWSIFATSTNSFQQQAFNTGFYAVAYKKGNDIIIAYRGTDKNSPGLFGGAGSDAINGYGIALGQTETNQGILAARFYREVAGVADDKTSNVNVTLTGHSLGGGLAGYIGSVSGTQAITFDHMPFGLAAVNRAEQLGVSVQFNKTRGYWTDREFLEDARDGDLQTLAGGVLGGLAGLVGGPLIGPALAAIIGAYGGGLGGVTAALEQNIEKTPLDSHYDNDGVFAGANYYHSMALLTLLLWAKAENKTDWTDAGQQLWSAYFDPAVAKSIPSASESVGVLGEEAVLNRALAYSAISEGDDAGKPFGDTAIHALFDDAGDLGKALRAGGTAFLNQSFRSGFEIVGGNAVPITKTVKQVLADMLVQYAGKLALGDVEQAEDHANVKSGILTSSLNGGLLSIDLSDQRWSQGAAHSEIVGRDGLVKAVMDLLPTFSGVRLTADEVERVVLATGNQGGTIDVSGVDAVKTTITVGGLGAETVHGTSARDVMIGGGGAGDVLDGGAGNDVIFADVGQRATTIGGLGRDWIYNTSAGGIIWGDVVSDIDKATGRRFVVVDSVDAQGNPILDAQGNPTKLKQFVADDASNGDNFWWAGGTTIMDAGRYDVLKFFGLPLTGGASDGGSLLNVATGGKAGAAAGLSDGAIPPLQSTYVDHLLPFITYSFARQADGSYDLKVGNVFDGFLRAIDALAGNAPGGGIGALLEPLTGVMTVKNFIPAAMNGIFAVSYLGGQQGQLNGLGPLNMVFKKANPFVGLSLLNISAIENAITAAFGGNALADAAMTAGANDNEQTGAWREAAFCWNDRREMAA